MGPDGALQVGGRKERAVLTALAAQAGEVVSAERLVDALWGDGPPRSAGKLVQNLVLRLRKALGRDLIETRPGGYLLRIPPESLDVGRFETLAARGRAAASEGDPEGAVAAFTSGLELWRGPPLGDLADWPVGQAEATRLEELRRCVEEELADAALSSGLHRDWAVRLESLVAAEPLRERRWVLLMVALYRDGRQAEALRAYQRARAALGELGLEPGPELQATERAVTTHDPSVAWTGGTEHPERDALPTGLVTFLLTDIEGSSSLWERSPSAMADAIERHDELVATAVGAAGGAVLKARGEGDSTFSVFTRASTAVAAAAALHEALEEVWPAGVAMGVRMAVHTGEAHERAGDYYGPTVNRAARLRDLGAGGQLLLSEAAAALVRDDLPAGWDLADLGEHTLRGMARPERVFGLVPSGATLGRQATVVARSCPYMGLLPFGPEDERLFFGRDDVVATMRQRLARGPFLAIVGASGSGKSSLLRAGLVARLERGDGPNGEPWVTAVCTPTGQPLAELAARIAPLCSIPAVGLLHALEEDPRALDVALREALAARPDGTRICLAVDQLEELFTMCRDEVQRQRFLDALVAAASVPDGRIAVVVAMRADFFGHGAAHPGLARLLEAHSLLLGAMDEHGLRAAIEGPAAAAGLTAEPGLADVILRDVTGEPGGLPLLSHALVEVWSRREGRTLTIDGYRASGRVAGAIARTADAVYDRLDRDQQRVARDILLRLTDLGEGTEDTARRATIDELARGDPDDAARPDEVLGILAAARLITVSEETVEVAHEALIREWPRLRSWLDEDRDGLRIMRHLTVAAHEWNQRGRDDSDLYRGPRLAAALDWKASHHGELNPVEREFLADGQRLHDAEVRAVTARNRRLRALLAGTALALVMALLAGALALRQRDQASNARDRATAAAEAETVSRLVAQSRVAQEGRLDLALLLALEARRRSDGPEARGALQSALISNPRVLGFLWGDARYVSVSVSSTGTIAAGTDQGTVDLWDPAERRLVDTLTVGDGNTAVEFHPNGTTLAVLTRGDQTLALWDVRSGTRIGRPLTSDAPRRANPAAVAFSHDGRVISAALETGEIATWRVAARRERGERLAPPDGEDFRAVAYSPDGRWLAAGLFSGRVALYDARTHRPAEPQLETGLQQPAVSLAFDRHSARLAAGANQAVVWDLATGRMEPETQATAASYSVAFSPRDDILAAGVPDGTALRHLSEPTDSTEAVESVRTPGGVATVTFSPDGTYVAAGHANGSISLVDAAGRRKLGEPVHDTFPVVAPSPNGDLVAAPGADGSVTLLDADDGRELRRLSAPDAVPLRFDVPPNYGLAFSADGRRLAYGGLSGRIAVFDVATGHIVQTLTPPPARAARPPWPVPERYVGPMAFSPDGTKLLATGFETGTIFDLATGRAIAHPHGWGTLSMQAFFTPDGALAVVSGFDRQTFVFDPETGEQVGAPIPHASSATNGQPGTLVTSDWSGTIRIIDLTTRQQVGPSMNNLQAPLNGLYMLPGGRQVAALNSNNKGVQLFDVRTGQPIGAPFPTTPPWGAGVVSADGRTVYTNDGMRLMRWNLDQDTWPDIACAAAGRNLTPEEWATYLPNAGPYRATCPDQPARR